MKFLPMITEVREVKPFETKDLFIVIAQMRPISGFKFNLFTLGRVRRQWTVKSGGVAKQEEEVPVTVGHEKE